MIRFKPSVIIVLFSESTVLPFFGCSGGLPLFEGSEGICFMCGETVGVPVHAQCHLL